MILRAMAAALACTAVLAGSARAQATAPGANDAGPAAAETATGADDGHIPAKSIVEIETSEEISSKTNHIGDMFALKLAAPLVINGRTILPAGLTGRGEVTHAAPSGKGGRAGELIVNARYLECGDLRIPLGHFHYSMTGKENVGAAFATAQVIPFGQFLVSGHDAVIPVGTKGTAQVNAEVVVPAGSIGRCASPAP